MKTKSPIKLLILAAGIVITTSCLQPVNPVFERTEAEELAQLHSYIDTLHNRGLDVDTTDLGVYYVVEKEGDGPSPTDGDTCVVKYVGFLLSTGYIFDDSAYYNITDSTSTFILGGSNVIPGWEDGLKVIQEGARVYLIIPSSLAYGETGNNYNIGPYETLIFRTDMVDIKQAY